MTAVLPPEWAQLCCFRSLSQLVGGKSYRDFLSGLSESAAEDERLLCQCFHCELVAACSSSSSTELQCVEGGFREGWVRMDGGNPSGVLHEGSAVCISQQ